MPLTFLELCECQSTQHALKFQTKQFPSKYIWDALNSKLDIADNHNLDFSPIASTMKLKSW